MQDILFRSSQWKSAGNNITIYNLGFAVEVCSEVYRQRSGGKQFDPEFTVQWKILIVIIRARSGIPRVGILKSIKKEIGRRQEAGHYLSILNSCGRTFLILLRGNDTCSQQNFIVLVGRKSIQETGIVCNLSSDTYSCIKS